VLLGMIISQVKDKLKISIKYVIDCDAMRSDGIWVSPLERNESKGICLFWSEMLLG
jgi:hypothetical protein